MDKRKLKQLEIKCALEFIEKCKSNQIYLVY